MSINFSNILNLQLILFSLIAIGTICRKKNIIKPEGKIILTDLLIYIFLPCNIITSFNMKYSSEILIKFFTIFLFACFSQLISFILSKTLYKKEKEDIKKVLEYATITSNSGFMGLPIIDGIYGVEGLMYASVALVPQRIMMWSAGISCFTKAESPLKIIKKVIFHPCIIAVYIGIFLMIFSIKLPYFLSHTIKNVGDCTTSISMILIGIILGEIKSAKSIISPILLKYTFIRLIVIPFLVFMICKTLNLNYLSTGIVVLISGMPAGSTTAILASKYNGDYIFGSKAIVFSTLMSIITIPLWSYFLDLLK